MQDFATRAFRVVMDRVSDIKSSQAAKIMKLTGIYLVIASLHLSARGFTQTITVSVKDASIETVFKAIEKQTDYVFFVDRGLLSKAKKVTINASNLPLTQVLDLCFKEQPFTYSINGKIITLAIKKEQTDNNIGVTAPLQNPLLEVRGKVMNPNGEPVVGATVAVRDGNKTTTTNGNGEFVLENIEGNAVLIITSIGYEQIVIGVNNRTKISLTLPIRVMSLDEFQVIAYGQTTKRLNTGNVSSVKASDISKQPVNNAILALQGRVPGMEITQATGLPGGGIKVRIRGTNSLSSGTAPLFIIDGVPYPSDNVPSPLSSVLGYSYNATGNPLSFINPADIESIDVLKDADATAIYGSRGANGVVLITTKKGKAGKTEVSINAQTGFGQVPHRINLLNTRQYLDMRYEAFRNDGVSPNPNGDYDLTLWDTTRYTDWQKELIGGTSKFSDINASVSGGNENTQILIGGGYHKESTVFPGDLGDQKTSVKFNINNASPNKKFRVSLTGLYTYDNNRLSGYDLTQAALTLPPNAPAMYKDDGTLNWAPNAAGGSSWPFKNPAAMLLLGYSSKTNNLVSSSTISYQVIRGLDIKTGFGYTNLEVNEVQPIPLSSVDPATWPVTQRRSSFSNNDIQTWNIEPQATFSKEIFGGQVQVLAGATILKTISRNQTIQGNGYNSDLVMEDINSATTITPRSALNEIYRYGAVFGRISYNFQNKYLVNLVGRRDGSSRFGPANRFHNFGSVGLGWIFSSESFFKVPFVSYGKMRTSYGTAGNDQVGNYSFVDLYTPVQVGVPYFGTAGIYPNRIYTPDLQWENTRKMEVGLELGFLKDKVLLSVSSYLNHSNNLLVGYPIPAMAGFASVRKNLNALIENKGLEFEVKTQNVKLKDFSWSTSLNVSMLRSKLVSVPSEIGPSYATSVGKSLSTILRYHFLGVDPITGLYQVADAHGTPTSNPTPIADYTSVIDFSPSFFGGVQNSFNYNNFQLDVLFTFVEGKKAIEYQYNYLPGVFGINQPTYVLNRWRQPGDVAPIQRFSQNYTTLQPFLNAEASDQSIGDASFIRLKNLSLSWQLPAAWKQKTHMQNARLFAQGQNIFIITKYRGLDPENASATALPQLRVITLGFQLTF